MSNCESYRNVNAIAPLSFPFLSYPPFPHPMQPHPPIPHPMQPHPPKPCRITWVSKRKQKQEKKKRKPAPMLNHTKFINPILPPPIIIIKTQNKKTKNPSNMYAIPKDIYAHPCDERKQKKKTLRQKNEKKTPPLLCPP